jgi:hypothetical protein
VYLEVDGLDVSNGICKAADGYPPKAKADPNQSAKTSVQRPRGSKAKDKQGREPLAVEYELVCKGANKRVG